MKGIQYLTDETGKYTAVQVDISSLTPEQIEDIEDIIECYLRKGEPTVSWEKAKKELRKKGKLTLTDEELRSKVDE